MRPAVGAATPEKPGPDEPGIAVRLEDLGMSFGKGATAVEALKGIDARIPAGRITGLVGPDAAGKTTLIRILAGLMQPTGGRALVFGRPAMELARREPNSIGYMPQRFGLYEDLTVMANLRLHASLRGLTGQTRDELFARLLGFTSLGPFTERLAGRLSGGMKQKLGIACALLGSPRLLLLDEPGVGVDPQSRRELWSMVQELSHGGMTVIWSTAYLDEAARCPGVIMLDAGKVLGVVGESGSGKSVSAMSILRLLDGNGYIDSGEILFNGQDLTKLSMNEMYKIRGNEISVIFQEPMTSLNPVFTVSRQISEPLMIHQGMNKKQAAAKAVELLSDVKIPNPEVVAKQYPHQLSGGMRQRVMIAMALACRPKLLIADEPTTALDVTIQAQILKLMNELREKNGTAVLFITHDLGVINQMADNVAVMYCGQVVEYAPAGTIFHKNEYSHPYTEGLMLSIPRLDTPSDERLEAIPGAVPHPLDLPKGCKFAPRCKYATERCLEEEPELIHVSDTQQVRCFYAKKEDRYAK